MLLYLFMSFIICDYIYIYMSCMMICIWLHPCSGLNRPHSKPWKPEKSRMAQGQSTSEFANFNAFAAIEEADQFWRSWKIKLRGQRVDLKGLYFDVFGLNSVTPQLWLRLKKSMKSLFKRSIYGINTTTHPGVNCFSQESIRSIACKDAVLFLLFLQDMNPTRS